MWQIWMSKMWSSKSMAVSNDILKWNSEKNSPRTVREIEVGFQKNSHNFVKIMEVRICNSGGKNYQK